MQRFTISTKKEKRGYHLLLVRYLRPTTALCADEQSDTHAGILLTIPTKVRGRHG